MAHWFVLVYGIIAYLIFLGTFLYIVGFVGGLAVPKTIDSGPAGAASTALLVNLALLGLFAVQHSVMARPAFKEWWTRIIPPVMERSTYVLASNLVFFLLFWLWQPLPSMVWQITQPWAVGVLWTLFGIGWLIVLASTFLINHFHLFGLQQTFSHFTGRPKAPIPFQTPWLYHIVRHPLMIGFLIAFWAIPTMTQGHLLFAAIVTVYVLIAVQLEERDLLKDHGETYSAYRQQVPMLVPFLKGRQRSRDTK